MDENEKKRIAGDLAGKMKTVLDAAGTADDEKFHAAVTDAVSTAKAAVDKIAGDATTAHAADGDAEAIDDQATGDEATVDGETASLSSVVGGKAHGLFDSLKKGWADYTSDVREPEDVAPTEAAVSEPSTSAPGEANPSEPVPVSINPIKVVGKARQIGGSFLNGVLGRPQPAYDGKAVGKGGTAKTVFKVATGIFAVLGLIAVIRATMDAFKPRH